MADLTLPIQPAARPAATRFVLALSSEEKSRDGLLRALCLRAAFLSLLSYCLYSAFFVIRTSWGLIGNQWENSYPEGPHVYAAIRSALMHRLYFPFTEQPYVLQSYGPLFYEMYYWMARAVHADIDRFIHLARLTDFLSFLLCGALIVLISRRLAFGNLTAVAAGTLFLGIPYFCASSVTTRPDIYSICVMAASLLIAVWRETPGKWHCLVAGALGSAAFLIKQPGIAVLLAIAIVWLLRKRFREVALLAAGAAVPVILMFGWLVLSRENFVEQYFSIGQSVWSLAGGMQYTRSILKGAPLLLPMGIGAIGFCRAAFAGERAQLIAAFVLLNWATGLAGMPQAGSAGNYFFAGFLGCGLLLPFAVELVHQWIKFAPVLLLIAIGLCYLLGTYTVVGAFPGTNFTPNAYQALHSFRILSDRPEFSLHGRDPDLLDPISIHTLELGSGRWTSGPVEAKVRNLQYDLIILACSGGSRVICSYRGINFFGPGVVQAMNQSYSVFCTNQNAIVLTPRERHLDVTPEMLEGALGAPCSAKYQGHAPDLLVIAGNR